MRAAVFSIVWLCHDGDRADGDESAISLSERDSAVCSGKRRSRNANGTNCGKNFARKWNREFRVAIHSALHATSGTI
jgi:hypothetical protein